MWTGHIWNKLFVRGISQASVEYAISKGEVIEDYPDDTPYPSCLILGYDENGFALHVVCSIDSANVWMITAYRPDPDEWSDDLRTRKEILL